jgi:hypothetical protein
VKDERGLTLYELLAALSIFFIASALIYGVFFGFNKNYSQISAKNSMDQAANLIFATIKQHHLKYDQYIITYNDTDQSAYIGEKNANTILGDTRYKLQIKAGYPEAEVLSGAHVIKSKVPLAIHIILTDKNGQIYEQETIIKRY